MERNDLLDHIFWHTLNGAHARHADGGGGVRADYQGGGRKN